MDTGDLLTAEEAAKLLGVKPGSVRSAMQDARIPVQKLFGRRLLRRADVLAYKERTQIDGQVPRGRPRKPNVPTLF